MKIERSQVTKITISDVMNHDPIRVYLEDDGDGRGRLIITEWSSAWTCYWSSMSTSLIDFIISSTNDYLIGNLADIRSTKNIAYKRFCSRLDLIRTALTQIKETKPDLGLFDRMTKKEFFTKLIDAADKEHKEFCVLKAADEGLINYRVPMYEAAIEHAKNLIEDM